MEALSLSHADACFVFVSEIIGPASALCYSILFVAEVVVIVEFGHGAENEQINNW